MIVIGLGVWLIFLGLQTTPKSWAGMTAGVGLLVIVLGVNEHYRSLGKKFSKVLYLLPVGFSILGSIAAFILFRTWDHGKKEVDKGVAHNLIEIGVVVFLCSLVLNLAVTPFLLS